MAQGELLEVAANAFFEISMAFVAEDLLAAHQGEDASLEKLREDLRTREQLRKVATEGFEVCLRGRLHAVRETFA